MTGPFVAHRDQREEPHDDALESIGEWHHIRDVAWPAAIVTQRLTTPHYDKIMLVSEK